MNVQNLTSSADKNVDDVMREIGVGAKNASAQLIKATPVQINQTLDSLADLIIENQADILSANNFDVESAKEKSLTPALIDRLTLTPERIEAMAQGVRDIQALDNPVGDVLEELTRPNGLTIQKISVPIGVLGMIYESRPNVTIDAAALCLKSQNAVILRGGSESFHSSSLLHDLVQRALEQNDLPKEAVSMAPSTDRAFVSAMLKAHEYIDVMIPRGGAGLTGRVMAEATMPVFAHLDGNCHIYIHESANIDLAVGVIINAKLRRTGICGAAESLLFDKALAPEKVKAILTALLDNDCAVVADKDIQALDDRIQPATDKDWGTEYLEAKISAKYIDGADAAITHINHYGSHHTDCIIAEDESAVKDFQLQVDSAIVMHNTSTQFADGSEFGMGAEIGIGTGKLHARGPVGVKQLTTFKYLVKGTGQTRP